MATSQTLVPLATRGSIPLAEARANPDSVLTYRQLKVLQLRGAGASTADIATDLGLSRKTVETHLSHIKLKLHLANSYELVRVAVMWEMEKTR